MNPIRLILALALLAVGAKAQTSPTVGDRIRDSLNTHGISGDTMRVARIVTPRLYVGASKNATQNDSTAYLYRQGVSQMGLWGRLYIQSSTGPTTESFFLNDSGRVAGGFRAARMHVTGRLRADSAYFSDDVQIDSSLYVGGNLASAAVTTDSIAVSGDGPFNAVIINGSSALFQVPTEITAGLRVDGYPAQIDSMTGNTRLDTATIGYATINHGLLLEDYLDFNPTGGATKVYFTGDSAWYDLPLKAAQGLTVTGTTTTGNATFSGPSLSTYIGAQLSATTIAQSSLAPDSSNYVAVHYAEGNNPEADIASAGFMANNITNTHVSGISAGFYAKTIAANSGISVGFFEEDGAAAYGVDVYDPIRSRVLAGAPGPVCADTDGTLILCP